MEYLLSLSITEKMFFIESMKRTMEDTVKYESQKIEVLIKSLAQMFGGG